MAKSNWATIAWNEKNEHSTGVFEVDDSISVEAYKNWLYLRDKQGWTKEGPYSEPVVAEIWSGELVYKNVQIIAKRVDLQNAMLFYCRTGYMNNAEKPYRHMLGICCYGFEGENWVGVTYPLIEELKLWIEQIEEDSNIVWAPNDLEVPDDSKSFNQGTMYLVEEITGQDPEEVLSQIQDEKVPLMMRMLGCEDKARSSASIVKEEVKK